MVRYLLVFGVQAGGVLGIVCEQTEILGELSQPDKASVEAADPGGFLCGSDKRSSHREHTVVMVHEKIPPATGVTEGSLGSERFDGVGGDVLLGLSRVAVDLAELKVCLVLFGRPCMGDALFGGGLFKPLGRGGDYCQRRCGNDKNRSTESHSVDRHFKHTVVNGHPQIASLRCC